MLPICRGNFDPSQFEVEPRWPDGTTALQRKLVRTVADAFPLSVPTEDLAKQAGVDARGVSASMRAAERRGLVEREVHNDVVFWTLTQLGARVASGRS